MAEAGVSGAGGRRRPGERAYGLLLRAYPADFRAEYGAELLRLFRDRRDHAGDTGTAGAVRFWAAMFSDLAAGAMRERLAGLRARLGGDPGAAGPGRPPYRAAVGAGLAVWLLYVATLAPTAAFWDAGEYVTVAHILGIPHPPGNPLFVFLARAWELLLAPLGLPVAVRINLFSATMSAAAHAFWFLVADRALAAGTRDRTVRRAGAAAAVLISATAFTVWNQSNVNEKVYTVSLLTVALVSWLALRWRDTGRPPRLLLLMLYLVALSATNHLMGVLVAPALVVFLLLEGRRRLLRPRLWAAAGACIALALSAQLFLPVRAELRPLVAEGEPACASLAEAVQSIYTWGGTGCDALSSVLRREQYDKPPITLDPTVYPYREAPRGAGLLAAQALQYAQYLDWQWARSVAGSDPLFGGLRPVITLLFLFLGGLGARAQWRSDRAGAAYMGVLFLTLSAGLVLYLNFKYGFSIAGDRFPDRTMHEVRERDYFFLIGFSVWGVWAGLGLAALWQALAERIRTVRPRARANALATPVLAIALVPLVLNGSWASRAEDYTARDWAYNVLMSVEPYGVLVTNGDNDSFPLWYVQKVERIREDVTIVLSPYLNTPWYVKQLRALTTPCPPGVRASDDPTRILCQRQFRPDRLPPALAAAGVGASVRPPEDSILPLSDAEIARIAVSRFVTREPLALRAGGIRSTIAAGTQMLPADTFVAAILQATLGERPIHFMAPTPVVAKLGLFDYTVRQGLTWRIHDGAVPADPGDGIVPLPRDAAAAATGAYIDLPRTDTLVRDVFLRRGRIRDPDAPWVDRAISVPMLYFYTHYAAAQAHSGLGREREAKRHVRRAEWWAGLAGE